METNYLLQRGSQYHFRTRVPSDLIDLIGRNEIQRSLRTADPKLARKLAKTLHAKLDAAFGALRHQRLLDLTVDELATSARNILLGSFLPATRVPRLSRPDFQARSAAPTDAGPHITVLIEKFTGDRRTAWEPKTLLMHSAALRLFVDIVADKPIADLTRDDCRSFRDTMLRLPPNMTKRFKDMTIEQVLAKNPEPMSTKNANKNMGAVTAFLNWCVGEKLISDNPARGLKIAIKRRADSERDAFGPDDLKTLFEHSALYRGCSSARERNKPGPHVIQDARFWLPLIGLYSGMRLEEIAQLRADDLQEVQGIWCFNVNADAGKKLKTEHSRRLVPVHSALIRAGLLEHAASVHEQRAERLWPDLERGNDGFYSSPFSKWFGRYKKAIGITNPKLSFHSLRHTVIDHLKQKGVEEVAIKELVGHANDSITTGRYGKRLSVTRLQHVVEQLSFPLTMEHMPRS